VEERIIGRKAIISIFERLYGIGSWRGVKVCCQRDRLPLRYTPSGKPFFISSELIEYDRRFQQLA
ncbi:MAG: hypothetical protein ABFD81_03650, partial [Syntrophaceae bacterium]